MTTATIGLPAPLAAYLKEHMLREPDGFAEIGKDADKLPEHMMRMSPEQGSLMALLVRVLGARRCLEVGTFVGYGTAWMASALTDGGRIVTCEIEPRYADIARGNWKRLRLEDRIELRMGPALATLDKLLQDEGEGSFDLAFLDADKERYPLYYARLLKLVRPGGLILIDNVFWGGEVANPAAKDAETAAIREVTRLVKADDRNPSATIPISDGLTIVLRQA